MPLPWPSFLATLIASPSPPMPAFVPLASTAAAEGLPAEDWAAAIGSAQSVSANVGNPPSVGMTGMGEVVATLGGVSKSGPLVVVGG